MQAMAATGGKSSLEATEWLLSHTSEAEAVGRGERRGASSPAKQPQQARVDRFFAPHLHRQATQTSLLTPHSDSAPSSRPEDDNCKVRSPNPALAVACLPENGTSAIFPSQHGDAPSPVRTFSTLVPPSGMPPKRRNEEGGLDCHSGAPIKVPLSLPQRNASSMAPLAERMRPSSIDDIVGQDHLLGPGCVLRSLVESDTMSSVILWGPPGTGKTSLARAIANTVSCRFVTASAVTSGVKEVRGILEDAKRSKKSGLHTLFFMDEVHRFNKAQQDVLLPYIEAGHVIFIGATTENPSFEINAPILSRCKVLILNKLQPESIKQVLGRAVSSAGRGVMVPFKDDPLVQKIEVEEEALHFLAESADGDARAALNALEIAVTSAVARERQRGKSVSGDLLSSFSGIEKDSCRSDIFMASVSGRVRSVSNVPDIKQEFPLQLSTLKESSSPSQEEYNRPFKRFARGREVTPINYRPSQAHDLPDELQIEYPSPTATNSKGSCLASNHPALAEGPAPSSTICVRLADICETLQRSHLLYDKKGEEHYNVISALHKSMRGGDPDAALYWLARMMEGGEGPLYVARRLIRFASEDVGLADSQALTLAVACYQACHFLGMPECNVHLAHCVMYLALAPKSVAVYQAIEAAQQLVKKRGNEPVPLHLRNAPTGLMKQLGYGKGYIYPPNHEGPIEQEYMPPSLQGHKFLK